VLEHLVIVQFVVEIIVAEMHKLGRQQKMPSKLEVGLSVVSVVFKVTYLVEISMEVSILRVYSSIHIFFNFSQERL